jgi:hypothetical protein
MSKSTRSGSIAAMVATFALACGPSPKRTPNAGRAPLVAPRVTPGELDAKNILGELPPRARALGAGPLSIVASGEAFEGERLGAFVDTAPDACLLAFARASSSVDDLDVAIFSEEGTPLAIDEAPDAHPTVLLCPPHPNRVYVAAHTASGEGLVVVGAQLVPRDRAAMIARALGARGSIGEGPRPADAWPGLDDHVRAHRASLGGAWEEIRKVALSVDSRAPTMLPFQIDADQCTDAVIVPGDEIALLDIEALDADGRVIGRAREAGRVKTLTVCSPVTMSGALAIRPHVGRGLAAVVLSRARLEVARDLSARPDVAWVAPMKSLDATRSDRNAELSKRGYDAPTLTTVGALPLGRRVTVSIDAKSLPPSACARIDVVAGAPLALLEASVWTDAGALVSSDEGSSSVTLFACAHGALRVELETRGRPGPFAVLVRPEKWKDALFAAHPLAAARMLARAADGPTMVHEGVPFAVRYEALDSARVSSWTENVAAGKCLRVATGAEGDGAGVELRLFDGTTAVEIDRSHGAHAASARACAAPEAARPVRVELRASNGKRDAIVGERVSP